MVKVWIVLLVMTTACCDQLYSETTPYIETDETTVTVRSSVYRVPKRRTQQLELTPPPPTRWVADALHDALGTFIPQGGSRLCQRHSQLYRQALHNLTLWAVQMYDASAHSASGLLPGRAHQLGHFDECVSLAVPGLGLTGRYCLADIQLAPLAHPHFHSAHPQPKYQPPDYSFSVWERLRNTSDLSHRRRDVVYWAVCVPASCSRHAVETSLRHSLQQTDSGLTLDLSLRPNRCYAREDDPPLNIGFYVVWAIVGLAATIAFTATGMDFFVFQAGRPHDKDIRRWLRPFSMYKNMRKLVTPNTNQEFAEFHLYKLVAIVFVISGHRQMYAIGQTPLYNVDWVEQLNSYFIDVLILNGGVVVDSFFVLSGFLTCHYVMQELDKHKRFNFPVVLFNRWIRVAPVYMLVVAFYALVLPRLGDGPLWTERLSLEARRCQDNWWTNLLFINNYVNADNQCMVQSWYLACDMHFFMMGSLLVYMSWRWPRAGKPLLGISLAASIAVPAAITYYNRYYGAVLHYMSLMRDPMSDQHYRDMYIPSHTRAGPYIVGIITAYIYTRLKLNKFQFSTMALACGSVLAAGLLCGSVLAGWICYDRSRPYSVVEQALYAGAHRSIWASGLAWFILAEATTGFGVLFSVVKHRLFTPFGRLTYCVFLIHAVPQIYLTASARVSEHLSIPKLFWVVTGDTTAAYILALYLNLLFEAPLEMLQKKLIKRLLTAKEERRSNKDQPDRVCNGVVNRWVEGDDMKISSA